MLPDKSNLHKSTARPPAPLPVYFLSHEAEVPDIPGRLIPRTATGRFLPVFHAYILFSSEYSASNQDFSYFFPFTLLLSVQNTFVLAFPVSTDL